MIKRARNKIGKIYGSAPFSARSSRAYQVTEATIALSTFSKYRAYATKCWLLQLSIRKQCSSFKYCVVTRAKKVRWRPLSSRESDTCWIASRHSRKYSLRILAVCKSTLSSRTNLLLMRYSKSILSRTINLKIMIRMLKESIPASQIMDHNH